MPLGPKGEHGSARDGTGRGVDDDEFAFLGRVAAIDADEHGPFIGTSATGADPLTAHHRMLEGTLPVWPSRATTVAVPRRWLRAHTRPLE